MADQNKQINTLDDFMKDLGSTSPSPVPNPTSVPPPRPAMPAPQPPRPQSPTTPTQSASRPAPSSTTVPSKGPSPMQAQFQPQSNPQPPRPASPTPRPIPPPVAPTTRPPEIKLATPSQSPSDPVAIGEYQSSIRTMKEDINGIKKGQKPSGTDVQKRVLKSSPTPISPEQSIAVPTPIGQPLPGAIDPTGLSSGHKSSFLGGVFGSHHASSTAPVSGQAAKPLKPWEAPTRKDNEAAAARGIGFGSLRISKKWFFIGLGSIVGLAAVYLVPSLLIKEPEIVITSPTPRPSRTPASSIKLTYLFGNVSSFDVPLASGSHNITDFYEEVSKQNVAQGQFRRVNFVETTPSSGSFSMTDIFDRYKVSYPVELKTQVDGDSAIFIYGQKEVFASASDQNIKRLVIAGEVKDLAGITSSLTAWSKTMLMDLNKIFNYEKQIPASPQFLDSSYRSVSIKYVNFSLPDLSLDYAIVPGKNNKNYLVFSNSRESIFEAIDRIRGQ